MRGRPLTYTPAGGTRGEAVPGYHWFRRSITLSPGASNFRRAAEDLLTWQAQLRAGMKVAASAQRVAVDEVVVSRLGPKALGIVAPCRVVYVIDEERRQGFGYGTLAGHAEEGEESFVLEHRPDDSVIFTVTAFSRPAGLLAKLSGPIGHGVQRLITRRYLRALLP
ncbi:DUF1990 domain-containing protein [Nakamurella silvestris]|nr:DUF1990 domain-containing protein [Nakamurella silvestris]